MKNSYTTTALIDLFDIERNTLKARDMDKSNRLDGLRKLDLVESLLMSLPADLVIENIEGCWKDGEIRQNAFVNLGSVVEAVVRYCMGKTACKTDGGRDCGRYEIKTSLTAKSLCTAPTQATCTIVVNALGVWKCYKRDFTKYLTAKKGTRFPHNAPCGVYMDELSEMLGFDPYEG